MQQPDVHVCCMVYGDERLDERLFGVLWSAGYQRASDRSASQFFSPLSRQCAPVACLHPTKERERKHHRCPLCLYKEPCTKIARGTGGDLFLFTHLTVEVSFLFIYLSSVS
jgi:hypothetical protein